MAKKSDQIASLFASVGFKVDKASLKGLESSLAGVEKRLHSIVKGFQSVGTKSLTSALRSTAKDSGKAAAGIEGVTSKLKGGIPALTIYTQQMRALASAMREVNGANPRRLPNVPAGGVGGGGGVPSPRGGAPRGFFNGLFGGGATGFARGIMPGLGAGWAVMHGVQRGREIMANKAALGALTGSQELGRAEYDYLDKFSDKYGLRTTESAAGYKRILASSVGTAMQGKGARDIFEGTSLYGKALGLSTENMSRASTALSQMMSKGTISSEELKGQLAEALPGAVQIFAKATNKTVPEMFKLMEQGKFLAKDVLPAVAAEFKNAAMAGGALEKMMTSSESAQARFVNAWDRFLNNIFQHGGDTALSKAFTLLAGALKVLEPIAVVAARVFNALGVALSGLLMLFDKIPASVKLAVAGFGMIKGLMSGWGWLRTHPLMVFLTALVLILDDIWHWSQGEGHDSLFGRLFGSWDKFSLSLDPFFKKFDDWVLKIQQGIQLLQKAAEYLGLIAPAQAPGTVAPGTGGNLITNPGKKSPFTAVADVRKKLGSKWTVGDDLGAFFGQLEYNISSADLVPNPEVIREQAAIAARKRDKDQNYLSSFAIPVAGATAPVYNFLAPVNITANDTKQFEAQIRVEANKSGL